MRVQIRRIGPEGLELTESLPADIIGLNNDTVLKFLSPFAVRAVATKPEDEVIISFVVQSRYESSCGRCLAKVEHDWVAEFTLTYSTKEFKEFVELDEDIRQELILNLPVRVLCRADCKGLCIDCGVNLNKETCEHNHTVFSKES
jgi:uncharacterized protein